MDSTPLYAAISEVVVPTDDFDFGRGVKLSPAQAHLMRPFLMTHREPDSSFPAFMSTAGSYGFDVVAQLEFPEGFETDEWFDLPNSVWWFAALLRLKATPYLRMPVLSNRSFRSLSSAAGQRFWPVEPETESARLLLQPDARREVPIEALSWVRDHWLPAGKLMRSSTEFNTLFQAFDQSAGVRDLSLALMLMWSSLEAMFSPSHSELRFRVSANIACFLEDPGSERAALQKSCAKLYDTRSAAAHGRSPLALQPVSDTYGLLRRVIERIIELNHVPTASSLESALFHGK